MAQLRLSDEELQRAVDSLLATTDPRLPQNTHFSGYAKEKLLWMIAEHAAGRLTVAFLDDPSSIKLPPEVLMAASQLDGDPTIFIVKPRFASWLRAQGHTGPPFTEQQRNDFSIALIHEVVHLQNPAANPRNPEVFAEEESRAWVEVTLQVVRPLRTLKRPMDQRMLDVDDALRQCDDKMPCPQLARLVRLRR